MKALFYKQDIPCISPSSIIFIIFDRNANAHTEWFSDNESDPGLSVLTTEKWSKTSIVGDLTIKEKYVCKQRYYFHMEILSINHHSFISLVHFSSPVSIYATFLFSKFRNIRYIHWETLPFLIFYYQKNISDSYLENISKTPLLDLN